MAASLSVPTLRVEVRCAKRMRVDRCLFWGRLRWFCVALTSLQLGWCYESKSCAEDWVLMVDSW